jgi:hypothetical protein
VFFVGLDVLVGILDVFKLLVLLQLLPVKLLQRAVHLNQVHATLHHHCVLWRFLEQVVNLLELPYDGGAASNVVIRFAIKH